MILRKFQWIFVILALEIVNATNFSKNSIGNIKIIHSDKDKIKTLENVKSLNAESLLKFNKEVLGLSTSKDGSTKNLFDRPGALIIFSLTGVENFTYGGANIAYEHKKAGSQNIKTVLHEHFHDEFEHAYVDSHDIVGSQIAKEAKKIKVPHSPQSKDIVIRNELLNMYKLADAIKADGRVTRKTVDYFHIHFEGSSSSHINPKERKEAMKEISDAITYFHNIAEDVYENGVVIEIYTHTTSGDEIAEAQKKSFRKMYQVARIRDIDATAIDTIIATCCFIMLFGVLSMITFLYDSEDMGKNSIAYRLSYRRVKKD